MYCNRERAGDTKRRGNVWVIVTAMVIVIVMVMVVLTHNTDKCELWWIKLASLSCPTVYHNRIEYNVCF